MIPETAPFIRLFHPMPHIATTNVTAGTPRPVPRQDTSFCTSQAYIFTHFTGL